MRTLLLAATIAMTSAASSMAQTPTPAPGPGQSAAPGAGQTPKLPPNSGGSPQPLTNGVQSSNGAKIAPNGGIASGVGMTTTDSNDWRLFNASQRRRRCSRR